MVAVTFRTGVGDTSNVNDYLAAAFTPGLQDLIIVMVAIAGSTIGGGGAFACTDNRAGGSYTRDATTALSATSANQMCTFVRNNPVTSGLTHTIDVDVSGDTGTGGTVVVWTVSGMTKFGASAIRQSVGRDNQTAGTTPTFTFAANARADNPIFGILADATNPPAMTAPANTTKDVDTGYLTPTQGCTAFSQQSGFTGTAKSWGASASLWGGLMVELDTGNWRPEREREQMHGARPLPVGVHRSFNFMEAASGFFLPDRRLVVA